MATSRAILFPALFLAHAIGFAQIPSANSFRVRPQEVLFVAAQDGPTPRASGVLIVSPNVAPTPVEILVDAGTNNTLPPDWLRVRPRRATTPARIRLEITRTDLAPGVYNARLLPRLVVGAQTVQLPTVTITLRVVRQPAELSVAPESLRLVARAGFVSTQQIISVANNGSGQLACQAVAVRGSPGLRITRESPTSCRFLVQAQSQTLAPGPYRGLVTVETQIGNREIPVSLQVYETPARMLVLPAGLQFEARQGNASPQTRNLNIGSIGEVPVNYRVLVVDPEEAPWIRLTDPTGTTVPGEARTVGVGVNPAGLAAGSYYALLRINGEGAANSPMFATVVLNIAPPNAQPTAAPSPSGLVFNVEAHTGNSAPQTVTVFTASDAPVPFQASAQALDLDRNWLNIAPATGNTSTGNLGRIQVTVNPLGLNAGTFEGQLNTVVLASTGDLEVRTVNVTMIVRPQGVAVLASASAKREASPPAVDCTPTALALTHTGLVTNFVTRAGWPTPLNVRLLDDCGQSVTEGGVTVSFNNGDSPLSLTHLRQGNYSGTWTPRASSDSPVGVRTEAVANGMSATFDLVGSVAALSSPVVDSNGIVNVFFRNPGAPLVPGTIVEIFGTALAGGVTEASLQDGRLPVDVNGVSVLIGGLRAPLYYLSPGQINAQIPVELVAGDEQLVLVRSQRAYSVPVPIALARRQPGLAAFADGTVNLTLDEGSQLITPSNPARRGGILVMYLVGLGPTNPPVASAEVATADPVARLVETPVIRLGDRQAEVLFAGLTPGFVGLYQLNIRVPPDITAGVYDLVVSQAGTDSNTVRLPVR